MKNTILLLLSLFFLLPGNAQPNKDEVIFKAMQDEIERNSNELMLPGMPKPFFISYGLGCFRQFEVVGILGSIVNATEIPSSAVGSVELLLGDYEHTSDASYAHPMTHVPMPGEADYDALRRGYWQGSDVMYKWALRGMAAKEAYEKANPQNVDGEKLPDLNKVPAVQKIVEDKGDFAIDMEAMENMVRELSVIFKDYKDIENSVVMLSGFDTDIYKKTSADVEMKQPLRYVNLVVQAQTMTADGERIGDIYSVVTDSPQKLPDVEKLKQDVVAFADNLMKLRDAEKLQEDYKDLFYSRAELVLPCL